MSLKLATIVAGHIGTKTMRCTLVCTIRLPCALPCAAPCQGEESRVVVLSLVRNNRSAKLGFVKARNRMNVLLSRAKEAIVVVGNALTVREGARRTKDEHWCQVRAREGRSNRAWLGWRLWSGQEAQWRRAA